MADQDRKHSGFWIIRNSVGPWGDYGTVLTHGFASRAADTGELLLQRTGHYLPAISLPRVSGKGGLAFVISEEIKPKLEAIALPGVHFRKAVKAKIVRLPWETWDRTAPDMAQRPKDGEPENYVLSGAHDPTCAAEMKDAFEMVLPPGTATVRQTEGPKGEFLDEFIMAAGSDSLPPIWRNPPSLIRIVVNDSVKSLIEQHAPGCARFWPIWLKHS